MGAYVEVRGHLVGVGGSLLYHAGPRDLTHILRLGGKHL